MDRPPTLLRRLVLGRLQPEPDAPLPSAALEAEVNDALARALAASGTLSLTLRPDIGRLSAERLARAQEQAPPGGAPGGAPGHAGLAGLAGLFGADALLAGSFEAAASGRALPEVRLSLRAWDAYTGEPLLALVVSRKAPSLAEALDQACAEVAGLLVSRLSEQPWQAYILGAADADASVWPVTHVRLSAGPADGLRPGMALEVRTQGDRVRSRKTGLLLALPGRLVATLRVEAGASARLTAGSLAGLDRRDLVVRLPLPLPPSPLP